MISFSANRVKTWRCQGSHSHPEYCGTCVGVGVVRNLAPWQLLHQHMAHKTPNDYVTPGIVNSPPCSHLKLSFHIKIDPMAAGIKPVTSWMKGNLGNLEATTVSGNISGFRYLILLPSKVCKVFAAHTMPMFACVGKSQYIFCTFWSWLFSETDLIITHTETKCTWKKTNRKPKIILRWVMGSPFRPWTVTIPEAAMLSLSTLFHIRS